MLVSLSTTQPTPLHLASIANALPLRYSIRVRLFISKLARGLINFGQYIMKLPTLLLRSVLLLFTGVSLGQVAPRNAQERQMIVDITPKPADVGESWSIEPVESPEELHWVVWALRPPNTGSSQHLAYITKVYVARSAQELSDAFAKAPEQFKKNFEIGSKGVTDPATLKDLDPNFTRFPDIGDETFSIWHNNRRFRMRRDRFQVEIHGLNRPQALELLRAYDRMILRYLNKAK